MVVRNILKREKLFRDVISQASQISKSFYIVDHGSNDWSKELLESFKSIFSLELIFEEFKGTMDEMKGKHYQILKSRNYPQKQYIFILDWDEYIDDMLIGEINKLDFSSDVYFINRHTYLIDEVIDRRSYLPLLFEINSVQIAPQDTFHKLYTINSKKTTRLQSVLHHYSYESVKDMVDKNLFYAKEEANSLFKQNAYISSLVIFLRFLYEGSTFFLYTLLYHSNFRSLEGWLYSTNWFIYKFYKYLFYRELQKNSREKKL